MRDVRRVLAKYTLGFFLAAVGTACTSAGNGVPPRVAHARPMSIAQANGSYASAVLGDSPRQYFQLNEGGGPTAYDSSAAAVNGTYVGAVAFGAPGPLLGETSTAVSLPGGSSSAGAQLPNPGIGASFSIEAWVYPAPASDYMTIWGYDGRHRLLLSSAGLLLTQFDGNYFSKHALTRNAWHDVVFVYDAASQEASYYIDGALDSSYAIPASYATFNSAYYAGQYDTGTAYKWKGGLAQIAVYGAALTSAQIANHYAAAGYGGAGGGYASAVLGNSPHQYFQLSESSGPAAYDSSPSAVNGTYVGTVAFGAPGPLLGETSTAISLAGGSSSAGAQLPNPGISGGTSFSIEAWVYPAPASDYMAIWGYNGRHRLLLSSAGLLLTQFDGNYFSKHALTRNAWHHIVFVYDAAAQQASYYIDGVLDSSYAIPASYATFNSAYYAGQYDTGTAYKWKGSLAQIAVYDAALTSAQIANHYAAAGYGGASAPATPSPSPSPTPLCGSFRWAVKTATDASASAIDLTPANTTISSLIAIAAPQSLSDATPRIDGTETTVYRIANVTLVEVFKEHDRDYHLLVRDANGHTMITEVPDPSCARNSTLYDRIVQVRKALDAQYPALASGGVVTPDIAITEEGAAFFDGEDITSGEAPNGIELHPLTAICFGTNCTPNAQ